jgi:quercetin dioxygenase-like cupin family protein
MRLTTTLTASVVAAALLVACGGATATPPKAAAAPGPVTKFRNTLPGLTAVGQIDLVQTVFDFAPSAASAVHMHPTPNLATVLAGQITVKMSTGDKTAVAGDALVEPINQAVQAVNTGSGEAMVLGAFPVPHGGKPTTPVAGQPAPSTPNKTLYTFTLDSPSISGGYSIVQQVLDFGPGSQTAKHRVGGPGVVTVLQGQVTLSSDGTEKTYNAGDSFTETPGQTLQVLNRGNVDSVLGSAFLVPDGAQLTTNI